MEEIFARASLSYLTNRFDEGFQLIYSSLMTFDNVSFLNWEEEQVFCLLSTSTMTKRCQSWIRLKQLLLQTDDFQQRQAIKIYLRTIFNEIDFYSNRICFLIDNYLLNSSISNEVHRFYVQMKKQIEFIVNEISQL